MTTTGYNDAFGRTVSGGLGVATSGQTYTLNNSAAQYSVAPGTASIAINSTASWLGFVDRQTSDIDITGQVAISSIPVTNLATVGFNAKLSTSANYYAGTLMVQTLGIMSLRFSKVIAGGLTTLSTTLIPFTYTAGTFYNLRFQCYWSQALQTNVMNLKAWPIGGVEPGGWMATTTDAALTQYTGGTNAGLYGRDESTALGTVTTRYQNVVAKTYALPVPATTDPMCADPAVVFPKQTALQSLAVATDAAMVTLDPLTSLAELFPRVRVSATNQVINTATVNLLTFDSTEFNVGTDTNLGYDNSGLYLPVGVWQLSLEIRLAEAASNYIIIAFNGQPVPAQSEIYMRSNAAQLNDNGVGGCGHASSLAFVTDPANSTRFTISMIPINSATTYTVQYMAFSAIKISDYFG